MGNSTFNGPVRSENGFTVISKNSTTGAITTEFTLAGDRDWETTKSTNEKDSN